LRQNRINFMPNWGRPLPDFPWDLLIPYAEKARAHSDGIVDLSIGTPVDPTPKVIQTALAAAADSPGYPTTIGTPAFRKAAIEWLSDVHQVSGLTLDHVIPSIGSKEIVAWLPTQLGLNQEHSIALPAIAYPTYEIGARLAGCVAVTADTVDELETAFLAEAAAGRKLRLAWINSPSNPTGSVKSLAELQALVSWARSREVLLVADECYMDLGWDAEPISLLNFAVTNGDVSGLLIVHSLSKRSNLAGYRAGFVAGDAAVIKALLEVRKHGGLILSHPVQQAAIAAFRDREHVELQKQKYAARRQVVLQAVVAAGFEIKHSQAGLYVWATRHEDDWQSLSWFADRGILVAPGSFYGAAGKGFVRIALTATDERIMKFSERLQG
jgi:succinyldiaminopimelate transaminase